LPSNLSSLDTRYVAYEFVPAIFDHKNSVIRNVNGSEMEAKVVRAPISSIRTSARSESKY